MGIDNPVHLIFIAAVALIVLGPKRLPDLARSLGHGMREFRDSMSEAVKDEGPVTGSLIPEQAQLVASPESLPPTPPDAVVVDPAAPEQPVAAVHQAAPVQAVVPQVEQAASTSAPAPAPTPAPSVATETVAQPAPPPAA